MPDSCPLIKTIHAIKECNTKRSQKMSWKDVTNVKYLKQLEELKHIKNISNRIFYNLYGYDIGISNKHATCILNK